MRCSHTGNVRMMRCGACARKSARLPWAKRQWNISEMLCVHETKSAHACVQAGVVSAHPVALTAVSIGWVRNCQKNNYNYFNNWEELLCKRTSGIRTQFDLDNVEVLAHANSFLRLCGAWTCRCRFFTFCPTTLFLATHESAILRTGHAVRRCGCWRQFVALTTCLNREFQVVSLTIALTICRLANFVDAIFASSKTMKMSSTRMLVTSWMRRMADDVLLRNILPNLCSASQGTLAVNGQSCYVNFYSFHLLG